MKKNFVVTWSLSKICYVVCHKYVLSLFPMQPYLLVPSSACVVQSSDSSSSAAVGLRQAEGEGEGEQEPRGVEVRAGRHL